MVKVLVLGFSVAPDSVQAIIIELTTNFFVASPANYAKWCEKILTGMCCHSKSF
jgi:hypothetical protein